MLSRSQGHNAAGKNISIEKFSDLTEKQPRDLPACSILPQPTTLSRAPNKRAENTWRQKSVTWDKPIGLQERMPRDEILMQSWEKDGLRFVPTSLTWTLKSAVKFAVPRRSENLQLNLRGAKPHTRSLFRCSKFLRSQNFLIGSIAVPRNTSPQNVRQNTKKVELSLVR
jgi:hypothetical protein